MIVDWILQFFSGHEDPVVFFSLLILGFAVLAGVWLLLSKCRRAKFYLPIWIFAILLLTAWWGGALINAIKVGPGLPGNGWDAFGAAINFFFSIPALILDIILLINWPKKRLR
jgi:hypothetical protein